MNEQQQNLKRPVAPFIITVLITVVFISLIAAVIIFWQKSVFDSQIASLKTEIDSLNLQLSQKAESDWNLALSKISACDAKIEQSSAMPAEDTLSVLGLKSLLEQGYNVAQICRDDSSNLVAFILAKQELTKPASDVEPTCVDNCDKVVFGTINTKSRELNYKMSSHKLGIYAEAYNQYCLIDHVGLNGEMFFYCGSGESGGLTDWYYYQLNSDQLTSVQSMTNLGPPETFDIKSQPLLDLFRYKSNAEMHL
jgi:hypothetical protein